MCLLEDGWQHRTPIYAVCNYLIIMLIFIYRAFVGVTNIKDVVKLIINTLKVIE